MTPLPWPLPGQSGGRSTGGPGNGHGMGTGGRRGNCGPPGPCVNRTSLLAINQLATDLKALEVGISGRVSRDRNGEYMQDLDALYLRCLD